MLAFANHQPLTYMSNSIGLLAEGHGRAARGTPPVSTWFPRWYRRPGIILVFAPLTGYR